MAGRPKQPLSVIQGKGKSKHLTKKVIKDRQEQEEAIKGHTDNVAAPSWLTKTQQDSFNELAKELIRINIFSNLDVDHLARYIDTRDEHIRLAKDLRKMKRIITVESEDGTSEQIANESYMKLRRIKNLTFNECKASASELGLSITSRLKLVIPKADEKEESEFDRKFGDV